MITYGAIHQKVRYYWGRASKCERCNTKTARFEWSNKDHKYNFIREEWQQLCTQCHREYDIKKFGKNDAWNKGQYGRQSWHNTTGLRGAWNRGLRKRDDVKCRSCKELFYPPKVSSVFCSKNCAMLGNKRARQACVLIGE